jgi:hypothetical protein
MSSITAIDVDLDVPHEFLEEFLGTANMGVMGVCESLSRALGVGGAVNSRHTDDELLATVAAATALRTEIVRALDVGTPVAAQTLRGFAKDTLEGLSGRLHYLTEQDTDPDDIVKEATLLRDLTVWIREHDLMPAEAVTA